MVKIVISLLCVADLGQLQQHKKTTDWMCEYPVTSFQGYKYFRAILCFRSRAKARYTEHSSLKRRASRHHCVRILAAYSVFLAMCILIWKESLGPFIFILDCRESQSKIQDVICFLFKSFSVFFGCWKKREMFHSLKNLSFIQGVTHTL